MLLHAGEVPLSSPACFHCQQCAEKYLKAYLQEHAVEFARNHELLPLLELSTNFDPEFKGPKRDLESLNRYAVATRYPGMTIKVETAEAALASTKRIRKFVRRKLNTK